MKVSIKVPYIRIRREESLAIIGGSDQLGNWTRPVVLDGSSFPVWKARIDVRGDEEYKFVVVTTCNSSIVRWESGDNRVMNKKNTVISGTPRLDDGSYKAAGSAVPVFSLRSRESFGVGEFTDIKLLVDWAAATGQSFIQLLPINDTIALNTTKDSYPYSAVSSFALHPMFLNLSAAGLRKDSAYKKLQQELNGLPQVDFLKVNSEKKRLTHTLFEQKGASVLASAACKKFIEANSEWLLPYAVFCALRDSKGSADFSKWGRMAEYSPAKAEKYIAAHKAEVDYHCFVQFLLDKQLKEAVEYAHAHRVVLKGDLPIGISRLSADAWCSPKLFNMDSQAGAPPDFFSMHGQNWGFPTYNWEEMAKDGYAWWKSRMRKMAEYFDAFRIDHILGFFRIWEIPVPEWSGLKGHFSPALPFSEEEIKAAGLPFEGLFLEDPHHKGMWHPMIAGQDENVFRSLSDHQRQIYNDAYNDFFYHRHNSFWKDLALKKLPQILGSTNMLPCGEDLGMIAPCVPEVMSELGILSLEMQRMPKEMGQEFGRPEYYPYMSVCTTSTHDMTPMRAWWEEENKDVIQRFYNNRLGRWGVAPYFCEADICEQIVTQHLWSPSMLAIFPVQDWMAMDAQVRYDKPAEERINDPGNGNHYWRYRMHICLEDLLASNALNSKILAHVGASGRI